MLKYLEIPINGEDKEGNPFESVEIVAADDILYCVLVDEAVRLYLKGANSYLSLAYQEIKGQEGRGVKGSDIVKAINSALISAAETTWTRATSKIIVPPGLEVTAVSVEKVVS